MFYKAEVTVYFEIHTKHINAIWAPWIIVEYDAWWYVKLPLSFKRLHACKCYITSTVHILTINTSTNKHA
jgi:hypothetical protein